MVQAICPQMLCLIHVIPISVEVRLAFGPKASTYGVGVPQHIHVAAHSQVFYTYQVSNVVKMIQHVRGAYWFPIPNQKPEEVDPHDASRFRQLADGLIAFSAQMSRDQRATGGVREECRPLRRVERVLGCLIPTV